MHDFDTIVIGSGAGGLTAAVALANNGQRVLVCEQHHRAGGWCHSFARRGYEFSPGVHYLGQLGPSETFNEILQGLGVSGDLAFRELAPDGFEHVLVGDQRLDVPKGRERYRQRLHDRFPAERRAVDRFLDRMHRVADEFEKAGDYLDGWRMALLPFVIPNLILYGDELLAPFVRGLTRDPLLTAFLTARSGTYALPPSETSIQLHASVLHGHYGEGAYYPQGGAQAIPDAFVRQLSRRGGELRLSTRVRRILLGGGRARGVELTNGERLSARTVVSNADPQITYEQLVGPHVLGSRLRQRLRSTSHSVSCLSLFLATDLDLGALGFDGGNYWYYAHPNLESICARINHRLPAELESLFLSIPTLKDPGLRTDGVHTIEAFTLLPYDVFAPWAGQPRGARDPGYQALKEALGRKLLAACERVIPGLGDHLLFQEVGTPLTNERYCASHRGAMYGVAKTRHQAYNAAFRARSELPGLWLVGASTFAHGVMGVVISGLIAAGEILGCTIADLMVEESPPAAVLAAVGEP